VSDITRKSYAQLTTFPQRYSVHIQPVDALRGTIDRNRKTEKKELCQHIP
jgi:hypothetical protein